MNIRLLPVGLVVLCALSSCFFQPVTDEPVQKPAPAKSPKTAVAAIITHAHDTLTIAAVGDIMLGTSYPNNLTLPPDSARDSFAAIADELRSADVTMGNLEGTLAGDSINPAHYKLHLKSTAYLFRMPPAYRQVFKDAGFDVLSLANNHIGDFGDKGRQSTMANLDSVGIQYGGQLTHPIAIFKIKGVTYGFCSFSPNANVLPLLDLPNATRVIDSLKKQCDIVIVSFHGGGEGAGFEHVPRAMESYIGEKRGDVYAFAHNAIDAGADMVFGNGPHVSRGMELYKNRMIAYSLGNFCTYKSVSVEGVCGLAPLLKIKVKKKGEFLNGRLIALRQTHLDGLTRDSTNRVINRIRELTLTDFPESGLNIADDGTITIAQAPVLAATEQ